VSSMRSRRAGFTLIELLVVLAIIATLAGVVAPALMGNVGNARSAAARAQVESFSLALDAFRLDVQRYPTSAEGLAVLRDAARHPEIAARWRGPYLRRALPEDPWGRPWLYASPGISSADYDLYSLGRDGLRGGAGEDADVTSWGGSVP
jgi:general secretion pathway protein G